jgi:succinate-semialdehyde dehydrogenase/glutarate-semialdehyde dehydrogenase
LIAKFRNAGQTCVCANRIYVQSGVYKEFSEKLAQRVAAFIIGDGFGEGVTVGPLINAAALAKVESHLSDAIAKGATLATGGKRHSLGGTFFEPTVVTGMKKNMLVSHEETFGPIAPLFEFETEDEAVELANDTEFGLAGYFYSNDIRRVWRVAERLETGMVGINTGLISTEVAPFGGVKQSGQGREGSKYGADDYLELKYMCFGEIS